MQIPFGKPREVWGSVTIGYLPVTFVVSLQCVVFSFCYIDGQYFIDDCLEPITTQITTDLKPKIIDMRLTLIVKMGQQAC